ncbi:MAG: hypothetical protein KatS3mg068_0667 [Candidatus Sericytochromatia bacterium]|nr:MAG: hypothetical protein KatS3mg068_0667 [Candidatus Sericytochromatia bacterium]
MRIKVERSICGVKKYKIMSEKLKITDINLYNKTIGVCCGLFNFYIMN